MFKTSRKRIVATIMVILILVWAGSLGIIYASSYFEMSRQNEQMLKTHAELENQPAQDAPPEQGEQPEKPEQGTEPDKEKTAPGDANSPEFQLSHFYTVAISDAGEILEIENESSTIYTDEELQTLAEEIVSGTKTTGTKDNLAYYKTEKNGYTLVVFKDNTLINDSAATLLRYTLLYGAVALVIFFFLSVYLAHKIVQPLEENYQKQKQFVSDAGHELKTPVSVVSVNAELLEREIGNNQWLSNIQYENERMGTLVGQLLTLARTENVEPQKELLNLSHLVDGEILPFESVAFERGMCIESKVLEGIKVEGDSAQLKQLISILLDNAIQHSTDGKQVCLTLTKERKTALLSVTNTGPALSEEQKKQIFERFSRLDEVRNGESQHYGLGLAIAKAIAESHKGSITVLCHDNLVEFQVRLPIVKNET